jgi:hypothetical protein
MPDCPPLLLASSQYLKFPPLPLHYLSGPLELLAINFSNIQLELGISTSFLPHTNTQLLHTYTYLSTYSI